MALAERDITLIPDTPASTLKLFTFTRDQYHEMADAGWFEGRRVERIEGVIHETSLIGSRHMTSVMLATRALGKAFGDSYAISVQNSLQIGEHSDPEADIAVLAGDIRSFSDTLPSSAALIIEVSQSTLLYDQTRKASLYAQADVQDYWIINLNASRIEVYRQPNLSPDGVYSYGEMTSYKAGQTVMPLAAPNAVSVDDLLP